MRIVILDGFPMNPGDLSWEGLCALGECMIYDRTPAQLTVERMRGAEIAITNKVVFNRDTLAQLPELRYIGVTATGYNIVDIAAARERGIVVTNVPAYSTRSVAQLTFALLLELAMHVGHHADAVRAGRWAACPDFHFTETPLLELDGLTMGIIGLGRIGQEVAQLAGAFGMRVLGNQRTPKAIAGVEMVALDALLQQSDVVTLHCPLTAENADMINAARLAQMKPTAFLLNTARGPLVNEQELAQALNAGRIAGAGMDVLSTEPPSPENPLLSAKNCLITPHIAWATGAARRRLLKVVIENLQAFLSGTPSNVVS